MRTLRGVWRLRRRLDELHMIIRCNNAEWIKWSNGVARINRSVVELFADVLREDFGYKPVLDGAYIVWKDYLEKAAKF